MKAGINWSVLDPGLVSCEISNFQYLERMKRKVRCCFKINHTSDKEPGSLADTAGEGTAEVGILVKAGVIRLDFEQETRSCELKID